MLPLIHSYSALATGMRACLYARKRRRMTVRKGRDCSAGTARLIGIVLRREGGHAVDVCELQSIFQVGRPW